MIGNRRGQVIIQGQRFRLNNDEHGDKDDKISHTPAFSVLVVVSDCTILGTATRFDSIDTFGTNLHVSPEILSNGGLK